MSKQVFEQVKLSALDLDGNFVVDENIDGVLWALALYFSGDKEFETLGHGSLQKGLYLVGNIGTGKTLLMRAFSKFQILNLSLISATQITEKYQRDGVEGILDYLESKRYQGGMASYKSYCFDDLGTENTSIKHMGNELNVMERIILRHYENRSLDLYRSSEIRTHFTSNLDPSEIEKLYGTRVRSRLREMCNYIVIPGTDRRK